MKKLSRLLFSMQTMGVLMLLFAIAIGTATFIENDFGSTSAKAVIYNALWFDGLLALLTVNLVGRIIISDMISLQKLPVLVFHIAFIIIILGAAITRFISYEGMMHIRENSESSTIISNATYINISASNGKNSEVKENKVTLSPLTPTAYSESISIDDKNGETHKIGFRSIEFIPNATEVIKESSSDGEPIIMIIVSNGIDRTDTYMKYGQHGMVGGMELNFSDTIYDDALNISFTDDALSFVTNDTVERISMMSRTTDTLVPGSSYKINVRELLNINGISFLITEFYKNGKITYESHQDKGTMMDAVVVKITDNDTEKEVALRGGSGYLGVPETVNINGIDIELAFGSKIIQLPFKLQLVDFQLDRYPGSNSPSSYASDIILVDSANSVNMDYRIYMNHVLNYDGYRFFQSSYDPDEKGTVLSVSHDYWGTLITYIGYFFMSIGMLFAIFFGKTHFSQLGTLLKKKKSSAAIIALLFTVFTTSAQAQNQYENIPIDDINYIPEKQANAFGNLLVLTQEGRLKPVNSLSNEILRKVSRKDKLGKLNSDQVLLGIMSNPSQWQSVAMIKVTHPEIKKILGIVGKYASYLDFVDVSKGEYKLANYVSAAYEKTPGQRSKFDTELLKVDERLNVWFMAYNGDMLNILPNPRIADAPWFSPISKVVGIPYTDSLFIATAIPLLLESVKENNISKADEMLNAIGNYQQKYGADILPAATKIKYEILYNKLKIFNTLSRLYGVIGLIMLILVFIEIFRTRKIIRVIINILIGIVILGFIYQTFGLVIRWYISGHAPWSNGYETMIYVGWITLLAGLIFGRASKMTIAATTILASIFLMVAHLSWMDPEVTNLVPVLKSYWLTIHVSVITASYSFLALSCLLGLINLILMITKTSKNSAKLNFHISNLTAINSQSVTIGLYLLTIGTFLGGVWANESWGRYWGWDPKETWALISVIVYATIAHMHNIKGMKSKFAFNFATLVAYAVILMTYFGVNYYLTGLHSYAKGDPVPIPSAVYYSGIFIMMIGIWAGNKERANGGSTIDE